MMTLKKPYLGNTLIQMAAFIVVVAGLQAAGTLIVRFLLAIFISLIFGPIFFGLRRKKVPTVLAIFIVLIIILAFFILVGTLVGTSLASFTNDWPSYQKNLMKLINDLINWLNDQGLNIPAGTVRDMLNPGIILGMIGNIFTSLTSMFSDTLLILITIIFLLLEASSLPAKISKIWGQNSKANEDIEDFNKNIQRYMLLKSLVSLATGIIVTLSLLLIGVDYPLLWGLIAFLFNYVPTIGSILASFPPVILALVQLGWLHALITALIYLAINTVIGNFIDPRLLGKGLGLSPLIVFISVIFWGWVLGPIGFLLSVPLTMFVKLFLESREDTRWIAVLLGNLGGKKKSV
ncbi:MAG: AI-2E family transporter [candidate division KSB1 bacterium]|nr:AI-2E family transporter [candidate division KSB1 bacterium]